MFGNVFNPALLYPKSSTVDNSCSRKLFNDLDPDNVPGYSHVCNLASFLVTLREQATGLSTNQALNVIRLWDSLSDFDKTRTRFPQRFSSAGSGRFKSPKKNVALGVTSIERAVLGPNSTRANWPDCNRYVEATVEKLLLCYPSDRRIKNAPFMSRWTLIKEGYSRIQFLITSSRRVLDSTDIQLPSLNQKTIQQWYNKKGKERDLKILMQGIALPSASMTGQGAPAPKPKPVSLQSGQTPPFQFQCPPDTAGMAKLKKRIVKAPLTPALLRPILPMPSSPASAPVQFQVIVTPPLPTSMVPTVQPGQKRKAVDAGMAKKRKTATVKCPKCGEERTPPTHQQYMGFRYCGKTGTSSFDEWRASLKEKGVARKKKDPQ
ncbi:uncharacterized protein LOC117316987 [Pecten maximus]|uniref:uncharacterized protein LOC117316987 n=1 Tax=Pecten maximus TaxID=6579 RepID=UPI001458A647|nr:uncharacterized protein LOC117316987 [Pecten maximus]